MSPPDLCRVMNLMDSQQLEPGLKRMLSPSAFLILGQPVRKPDSAVEPLSNRRLLLFHSCYLILL